MVNQLSANHNKSCLFLASEAYFTNSVDSDQTASKPLSRDTLFASTLKLVSDVKNYMRQITKADNLFICIIACALNVKLLDLFGQVVSEIFFFKVWALLGHKVLQGLSI